MKKKENNSETPRNLKFGGRKFAENSYPLIPNSYGTWGLLKICLFSLFFFVNFFGEICSHIKNLHICRSKIAFQKKKEKQQLHSSAALFFFFFLFFIPFFFDILWWRERECVSRFLCIPHNIFGGKFIFDTFSPISIF